MPWLVGLSTFTLYPSSPRSTTASATTPLLQPAIWTGLDNYHRLVSDETFWLSLENTFIYAGFSLPLGMVVALSLALLLNCNVRGTAIFRTIFYLPSIVPVIASSMLWLWIFNPSYGLLNWALTPICHVFGTEPPGWLSDPNWSKPALILMSAWGVGNSMIIYLAGLQDVPEALYESAEIDGATKWQQFWHVTLPMIMPVVYFNLVMGIIGSLQTFTLTLHHDGRNRGPAPRSRRSSTPSTFSPTPSSICAWAMPAPWRGVLFASSGSSPTSPPAPCAKESATSDETHTRLPPSSFTGCCSACPPSSWRRWPGCFPPRSSRRSKP